MDVCTSVEACRLIVSVTPGWACPRATTAIPDRASRYRLPLSSVSQAPSPLTKDTLGEPYVFMIGLDIAVHLHIC